MGFLRLLHSNITMFSSFLRGDIRIFLFFFLRGNITTSTSYEYQNILLLCWNIASFSSLHRRSISTFFFFFFMGISRTFSFSSWEYPNFLFLPLRGNITIVFLSSSWEYQNPDFILHEDLLESKSIFLSIVPSAFFVSFHGAMSFSS